MLDSKQYEALESACKAITKDSNLFGVFSHAAISSCVGNRNIEFKALFDDGSIIETVSDKGFLLVSKDKGTRKNFDEFYAAALKDDWSSKKLLAYWLVWCTDVSGSSAILVGLMANEFIKAGIELPAKIIKFTTIRSTKNGVKKERVVKQGFTRDTLIQEVNAIVKFSGAFKEWIAESPTRSSKYAGNAGNEDDEAELNPVNVTKATADDLKEFEF